MPADSLAQVRSEGVGVASTRVIATSAYILSRLVAQVQACTPVDCVMSSVRRGQSLSHLYRFCTSCQQIRARNSCSVKNAPFLREGHERSPGAVQPGRRRRACTEPAPGGPNVSRERMGSKIPVLPDRDSSGVQREQLMKHLTLSHSRRTRRYPCVPSGTDNPCLCEFEGPRGGSVGPRPHEKPASFSQGFNPGPQVSFLPCRAGLKPRHKPVRQKSTALPKAFAEAGRRSESGICAVGLVGRPLRFGRRPKPLPKEKTPPESRRRIPELSVTPCRVFFLLTH